MHGNYDMIRIRSTCFKKEINVYTWLTPFFMSLLQMLNGELPAPESRPQPTNWLQTLAGNLRLISAHLKLGLSSAYNQIKDCELNVKQISSKGKVSIGISNNRQIVVETKLEYLINVNWMYNEYLKKVK